MAQEASLQLHFVVDVVEADGGAARLLALLDGRDDLRPGRPVGVDIVHHCNIDVISSLHNPSAANTPSTEQSCIRNNRYLWKEERRISISPFSTLKSLTKIWMNFY